MQVLVMDFVIGFVALHAFGYGLYLEPKKQSIMEENIINYANKEKRPLLVTINGRDNNPKSFKMTAKQLKESVKRHCAFYGVVKVSESYNDFEYTIRLSNGIRFDVTLY